MRNNTIMMASPIKKTQQLSQGTNFHLKGLTNQFFLTSANQYKKGKPKRQKPPTDTFYIRLRSKMKK